MKINFSPAEKLGGQIYLDISSIQAVGIGGSKFWCLLVDKFTNVKWSFFLKRKFDMVEKVITFCMELKYKFSKTNKIIQCDNAGKMWFLQQLAKEKAWQ